MSLPLIVRPEAEDDFNQEFAYLEDAQIGLGLRFAQHLGELFERIEANPNLYAPIWQDVRAARLKPFSLHCLFPAVCRSN